MTSTAIADIGRSSDAAAMSFARNARRSTAAIAAIGACGACGRTPADGAADHTQAQAIGAVSPTDDAETLTFFHDDRPLDLPAPDGRYRLITAASGDGLAQLVAVRTSDGRRQSIGAYEPPASVLWSPASAAFFVNDQRGSGQSSYLEVVRLERGRFRRDAAARANLDRLYNRLFECDLSEGWINTRGEKWLDASTIIVEVQASHRSGGCGIDPFAGNRLSLLVDATTGEVLHRRARPR